MCVGFESFITIDDTQAISKIQGPYCAVRDFFTSRLVEKPSRSKHQLTRGEKP